MYEDKGTGNESAKRPLSRREFVKLLAAATAATGGVGVVGWELFGNHLLTPAQSAEVREAALDQLGKLPKRPLGTRMGGMQVTPVVICQDWNQELYGPGLDCGINFVHKAGYWNRIPEAFQKLDRESYYTDITVDSTPRDPDNEDKAYDQVNNSLKANGLGYYDIFRAHFGWQSVDAYKNKRGTYRAFERLKKEGKVKYFGVSQHPYVPYPEIIAAEIDEGIIDCMQVWFTYGVSKDDIEIFDKAHRAGIGLTAMKVYANGHGKMRDDPDRQKALNADGMIGRALIRQVLTVQGSDNKPIFDCCVSNLQNFDTFQENIGAFASGTTAADGFDPGSVRTV